MAKARILVVDDSSLVRDILFRGLTARGYEVICAAGAREGLALVATGIELVLCDMVMPEVDGLAMLDLLQKNHPGIPTLMMTADPSLERVTSARALGAAGFLRKPIELAHLEARIVRALGSRKPRAASPRG